MSEEITTPQAETEAAKAPTESVKDTAEELAAWKSKARLWEGRAQENKAATEEVQKLQKESDQLREQLESLQAEKLQASLLNLVQKYSLPPVMASRLQGKNTEELEADAAALAEAMGLLPPKALESSSDATVAAGVPILSRESFRASKTAPVATQGTGAASSTGQAIRTREDFRKNATNFKI